MRGDFKGEMKDIKKDVRDLLLRQEAIETRGLSPLLQESK